MSNPVCAKCGKPEESLDHEPGIYFQHAYVPQPEERPLYSPTVDELDRLAIAASKLEERPRCTVCGMPENVVMHFEGTGPWKSHPFSPTPSMPLGPHNSFPPFTPAPEACPHGCVDGMVMKPQGGGYECPDHGPKPTPEPVEERKGELAACPFCGWTETVMVDTVKGLYGFNVRCENPQCHANGPEGHTREMAVRLWNTRTPTPRKADAPGLESVIERNSVPFAADSRATRKAAPQDSLREAAQKCLDSLKWLTEELSNFKGGILDVARERVKECEAALASNKEEKP